MMSRVNVGIVAVGNCASSLVALLRKAPPRAMDDAAARETLGALVGD
jgi:myo-inositol-1-phosphate synthase